MSGGIINKLSRYFDVAARWMVVAIMLVVMANVILRIFDRPLMGTVEAVQLFTALAIGLGLAHCGVQGGHVAVTFLTDKLPLKLQTVIFMLVDTMTFLFLVLSGWQLFLYGNGMRQTGEVTMTTGIPFYPFVYVVALSFLLYSLVVLQGIIKIIAKGYQRGLKDTADKVVISD